MSEEERQERDEIMSKVSSMLPGCNWEASVCLEPQEKGDLSAKDIV